MITDAEKGLITLGKVGNPASWSIFVCWSCCH
jgi:hypothetical protein